jgi:hypothetical protein
VTLLLLRMQIQASYLQIWQDGSITTYRENVLMRRGRVRRQLTAGCVVRLELDLDGDAGRDGGILQIFVDGEHWATIRSICAEPHLYTVRDAVTAIADPRLRRLVLRSLRGDTTARTQALRRANGITDEDLQFDFDDGIDNGAGAMLVVGEDGATVDQRNVLSAAGVNDDDDDDKERGDIDDKARRRDNESCDRSESSNRDEKQQQVTLGQAATRRLRNDTASSSSSSSTSTSTSERKPWWTSSPREETAALIAADEPYHFCVQMKVTAANVKSKVRYTVPLHPQRCGDSISRPYPSNRINMIGQLQVRNAALSTPLTSSTSTPTSAIPSPNPRTADPSPIPTGSEGAGARFRWADANLHQASSAPSSSQSQPTPSAVPSMQPSLAPSIDSAAPAAMARLSPTLSTRSINLQGSLYAERRFLHEALN